MALAGLEFIEDVLTTLLNSVIDENTIVLFLNVSSALHRFTKLSPYHAETVRVILARVRSIAKARNALYRSSVIVDCSPETALIKELDRILKID